MPPLENNDEQVKEGKELEIINPNNLLIRLPIF